MISDNIEEIISCGGIRMVFVLIPAGLMLGTAVLFAVRSLATRVRLQQSRRRVEQGQGTSALATLKTLVANHYGALEVHYLLSQALLQSGLFRDTARELELVTSLNAREKRYPAAHLARDLARCYRELGNLRDAQGTLLLALKAAPGEEKLLVEVAEIFLLRGMPRHAADYLESSLRLAPENGALLLKMAQVQERAGNLRSALEYAQKAHTVDSSLGEASLLMARLYGIFGNQERASYYYNELANLEGYRLQALQGKADCLAALGNSEAARQVLEQALEQCGGDSEACLPVLYRIADTLMKERRISEGITYLERIERIRSDFRDVSQQLEKLRDFGHNQRLADFVFSDKDHFHSLAAALTRGMGLEPRKFKPVKKRDLVIHAARNDGRYRDMYYLYFSRSMQAMGEWELRELMSEIRLVRMSRGIVFCAGGFAPQALEYAASRSLTLIDRSETARMLHTLASGNQVVGVA